MKIAVASGKGGTGKTTVAVALAKVIGDPAFIDLDVEAPNAYLFLNPDLTGEEKIEVMVPSVDESKCDGCGECGRVCQFNAMAVLGKHVIVFPELCHGCGACPQVCKPGAITETTREIGNIEWGTAGDTLFYHGRLRIGEPKSPPLIRALKEKAGAPREYIIMDCPPGTSCPMIEAVKDADYCVLVTEPTPFGMHDLEMAAEAVKELGVPSGVIINRMGMGDDQVKCFCEKSGLPILLEIPHRREIAEAYAAGRDILEAVPDLGDALKKVMAEITRRSAA